MTFRKSNYLESLRKMKYLTPLVDKFNNLHPDQLHQEWLEKEELVVLPDGRTRKRRAKGRPPGCSGRCSYCGLEGHYARSCPDRLQDGGMIL